MELEIIKEGLKLNLVKFKNGRTEILSDIMKYVYIVHHTHVISEENEDIKLIGAFSSKENAIKVTEKYKQLPGFREAPKGFDIDKYQIDEEYWSEGYFTTQ